MLAEAAPVQQLPMSRQDSVSAGLKDAWRQLVYTSATSQKRASANVKRYLTDASIDIQIVEVGSERARTILQLSHTGALPFQMSDAVRQYVTVTLREVLRAHTFTKQKP